MKRQPKRALRPQEVEIATLIKARLAELKRARGLTQERVAAAVGVTQGAVWQWANARTPVAAESAIAFARELDLAPEQISLDYRRMVEGGMPSLQMPARMPAGRLTKEGSEDDPDPKLELIRAQNSIQALRYVIGAMATMMASLRPAEGAAVAALIRAKTPAEYIEIGLGKELLQALDEAVRVGAEQPSVQRDAAR